MQHKIMANAASLGSMRAQLAAALEPCTGIVVPDVTAADSDLVSSASSYFLGEWERALTAMVADGQHIANGLVGTTYEFTSAQQDTISSVSALVRALEE